MIRCIFYFFVALMAFAIGAGSVSVYRVIGRYVKNNEPQTVTTAAVAVPAPVKRHKPYLAPKPLTPEERAEALFGPTIEAWLAGNPVARYVDTTPGSVSRLESVERYRAELPELQNVAQKPYEPSLIDIDGDKQKELAILPLCDDSSVNCVLWVLDKAGSTGFRVILTTIDKPDWFEVGTKRSQNYLEIRTYFNSGEADNTRGLYIYKFDIGEYSLDGCYEYEYRRRDKKGNWIELKNPKLVALHCC